MSERTGDKGVRIAKLITEREGYKEKLKVLPALLEERKITVEEFKTLKEDYKEKIEETQKEIDKLCGVAGEMAISPPFAHPAPRQVEYIPPRQVEYVRPRVQEQIPTIKVEQKQSGGLGTCAVVCLIIFIIILVILAYGGWSITRFFGW